MARTRSSTRARSTAAGSDWAPSADAARPPRTVFRSSSRCSKGSSSTATSNNGEPIRGSPSTDPKGASSKPGSPGTHPTGAQVTTPPRPLNVLIGPGSHTHPAQPPTPRAPFEPPRPPDRAPAFKPEPHDREGPPEAGHPPRSPTRTSNPRPTTGDRPHHQQSPVTRTHPSPILPRADPRRMRERYGLGCRVRRMGGNERKGKMAGSGGEQWTTWPDCTGMGRMGPRSA